MVSAHQAAMDHRLSHRSSTIARHTVQMGQGAVDHSGASAPTTFLRSSAFLTYMYSSLGNAQFGLVMISAQGLG
jgi:hypothetical protein